MECIWNHTVRLAGSVQLTAIQSNLKVYLEVGNTVYLASCFKDCFMQCDVQYAV